MPQLPLQTTQRAMDRTLVALMNKCSTRSELCDALKPNPRNVRLTPANIGLLETLETIVSLARNSIEQHQQPINIILDFGTTLKFPNITDGNSSTSKIAVLFTLIKTIQTVLTTGQTRTIRDVYYSNVELYGNQRKVEYWLSSITKNLRLESRDQLQILPAQKGLVYTPFDIEVETNGTRKIVTANTSSMVPYLAPGSTVRVLTPVDHDLKLKVVVLEKEAVYNSIVKTNTPANAVITTGKGYPDFLSRLFLNLLQQNHCIVDWRLYTDADPHGVDIALKYMQNEANKQYVCQKLVYKGATLTDLLKRRGIQFLQLNQRDVSLAIGLMKRLSSSPIQPQNTTSLKTQLQRQLFFFKKAEMNWMSSEDYFL